MQIEGYRLSPQQLRLWSLQEEGNVNHFRCAIRIVGRLDEDTLKTAILRVIGRHEILRTTFPRRPGIKAPIQSISERGNYNYERLDFSQLIYAEQQERIEARFRKNDYSVHDLERGPVLTISLFILSADTRILFFSIPSICADCATAEIFLQEIAQSYQKCLLGGEDDEAPVQYVQFSEWQNDLLEDGKGGIGYWRERRVHDLLALIFPTGKKCADEAPLKPGAIDWKIDSSLLSRLEMVAKINESSIETLLLACWQTLLWRLTGVSEFAVGKIYNGRKYEELSSVLGACSKAVPALLHFDRKQRFGSILRQIMEAEEESDAWLEYFVPDINSVDSSTRRLFTAGFEFRQLPKARLLGDVSFSLEKLDSQIEPFIINLILTYSDNQLTAQIYYDSRVLECEYVKSISECLHALLNSVVENPGAEIEDLNILGTAERQRLLITFNDTETNTSRHKCFHRLFEEEVERAPDKIAVVFDQEALTYAELNSRANKLARLLVQIGVGPDVIVGFYLKRSVEMVVGILGIMKASGAYLPLDNAQPKDRLAYQLSEARATALVTEEGLLSDLPEFAGNIICLDRDCATIQNQPEANLESAALPDNLAYVIYTSGSTGEPKGVAIGHRGLVNYSQFICQRLNLCDPTSDFQLQFANVSTVSADLGNTCIFPSLISGGCLHIFAYDVVRNGDLFSNYIAERLIDVLKIVPSHLSALLASGGQVLPRKYLLLGGESIPADLISRISEMAGSSTLLNHYGPTETTIGSLTFTIELQGEVNQSWESPPIGRPIANTQAYILDDQLKPVPIGMTAGLYIAGEGVARGYLNKPEQTAYNFVPNPFSTASRLYRTGDLARFLPGGAVEFLGRADRQVKIRGFRVELGEIETALKSHPEVKAAVVVTHDTTEGSKRLVAYVASGLGQSLTPEDLRGLLKSKLPDYMIPSAFVVLMSLPLTANGKVDYDALPAPDWERPHLDSSYGVARTPVEEILVGIWTEVIGVDRVGVHDNFFALGGDSILSFQIVARANRAGISITPKQLFERPTIAGLAEVASVSSGVDESSPLVGSFPLMPIQRWFFGQNLVNPHHWNMPLLLELRTPLHPYLLEKALNSIIASHEALRIRFNRVDSDWEQTLSSVSEVASYCQVDWSHLTASEEDIALNQAAIQIQTSLNLFRGPLLRAAYFKFATAPPALLIVVHHLIVDGVSWRVLLEDLNAAYEQVSRGEEVSLPPKTTSIITWARRLTDYSQSQELGKEADFWLARLSERGGRLPVDYPEGENTAAAGANVVAALSIEETEALLREVPQAYHAQINDLLLTALALAFFDWTGEPRLLVNLEGHGREEIVEGMNLARTVGWFTTHFPALFTIDPEAGLEDTLKAVKEHLRQIPNRGIGYGLLRYLREDHQVRESLSALQQPEVSFNYLGQFDQSLPKSAPFKISYKDIGMATSPQENRRFLLNVNAYILEGRLKFSWTYSSNLYLPGTIEKLAESMLGKLRLILASYRRHSAIPYTISDFPEAEITQEELENVIFSMGRNKNAPYERGDNIEDIYTLSPIQSGMLLHSLLDADLDPYFRQLSFSLAGALDTEIFAEAWKKSIARHSALRSCIRLNGLSKPHQLVYRQVETPLKIYDWRQMSPAKREELLVALLREEESKGFDLSKAPLMRLIVVRLADELSQFIWSYHHLIMDGWSRSLLFNEIITHYEAIRNRREQSLERARPYRDYIAWLRRQDSARAEEFWRRELGGFSGLARPGIGISRDWARGDYLASELWEDKLSVETTAGLRSLARRQKLTLNTIVQGAWAILLSHNSGERDVVFGSIVSGRPAELEQAESILGVFINSLPVRVLISPELSLLPWLQQLQQQHVNIREYAYTPLAQVQEWSDVAKDAPLFESVLNFLNYPVGKYENGQGWKSNITRFVERTHLPLVVEIGLGEQITLRFMYDGHRFSSEEIVMIGAKLSALLTHFVDNPRRSLGDIALLISPAPDPAQAGSRLVPASNNGAGADVRALPITEAQKGIWALSQIGDDASRAYHQSFIVRVSGHFDVDSMRHAAQGVVNRHEALRATFSAEGGYQLIHARMPIETPLIDLSHAGDERETLGARQVTEEVARPFDLARGPLFRALIIRLDDESHLLVITIHHIVTDGWSNVVVQQELAALYAAELQGAPCNLPPPMQFSEYVSKQASESDPEMKVAEAYWLDQFSGPIPLLELPTDRPRPAQKTYTSGRLSAPIDSALYSDLKRLSAEKGCTMLMTLLAAYGVLLRSLSGQDEFIVGLHLAGQVLVGGEDLVGHCVNLLPLRCRMTGDPPFNEYLGEIKRLALETHRRQIYPLSRLINKLNLPRDPSKLPLVSVTFNLDVGGAFDVNMGQGESGAVSADGKHVRSETMGLDVDVSLNAPGFVQWELSLNMIDSGRSLSAEFDYNVDLFDHKTVRRWMKHYETLLRAIVEEPEARMSVLQQRLEQWDKQRLAQKKSDLTQRLKSRQRKPVSVSPNEITRTTYLRPDQKLPLVIHPNLDGLDLAAWAEKNLEYLEKELCEHGAILFRDFSVDSARKFQSFAKSISQELIEYYERTVHRQTIERHIYTASEYPAEHPIPMHNEYSFSHVWPLKLWFYCVKPADRGGASLIADSRRVYDLIPPRVRDAFIARQVTYSRNYGEGLDLTWEEAFQSTDREEVEEYCRRAQISFEWKVGNRLRTRQVRQGAARHAKTGEMVWFNQAHLFHVSSLEQSARESLLTLFKEEDLPRHAFYGDGSVIEDSALDAVRAAYRQATVAVSWQPGDVLMIDNMLVAHGREPFQGSRQLLVAMAELFPNQYRER